MTRLVCSLRHSSPVLCAFEHSMSTKIGEPVLLPSTTVASVMKVCPSSGQVWRGLMSVAVWSGSLVAWERELAALKERIGPVFGRAETRETAGAFLDGLLSGVARKTGWLLAEQAGLERPYRMQSLLGRSRWDADGLRDRVRADVIEALGDRDGVLVVDETGFMKKGEHSVGVAPVFRHGGADRKLPDWRVPE